MSKTEKHEFQAEIAQLLEIVIHSLYTDKEIFVRELISNAADANEKLQFLQQTAGTSILDPQKTLGISVTTDDTAKTITITDTGIGMTQAELVEHAGPPGCQANERKNHRPHREPERSLGLTCH